MKVTLWGVRAQTATPGASYQKYGGNSLCIEIRDSEDNLLIIDLGTGARVLGPEVLKHPKKLKEYHILISSVQYDRILGLPFFIPIFIPNNSINIYGPRSVVGSMFRNKISESMSYVYFPVRMDELKADLSFKELDEKTKYNIGSFSVEAKRTNYITDCYAYKVTSEDKTIVYISSNEDKSNNDDLTEFSKNADILIHDSFFWKEEDIKGWGRSSFKQAMARASKAKVKKLIMFGLNPKHTDSFLDKVSEKLKDFSEKCNIDFEIGVELKNYIV